MRAPDNWRHMVLAVRAETDVAQENHFTIPAGLREGPIEDVSRVFAIPLKPLLVSAQDATGGFAEPLALRVVACPTNKSPNRGPPRPRATDGVRRPRAPLRASGNENEHL